MDDNEKSMKYFICFALGAAVLLPFCGEIYTNVAKTPALAAVAAWTIFSGIKFSSLPMKKAMLGISAYVFSSAVLSVVGYTIIHPAVKEWIEKRSQYFGTFDESGLLDWGIYWTAAFILLAAAYVVCLIRKGIDRLRGKSENAANISSVIDNAFED